jgi:hypothetical protein
VIHEFKGNKNEHVFIMFIREKAHVLDKLVIMLRFESFYCSKSSLDARMRPFLTVKWSSKLIKITFKISRGTTWNFRMGIDVSCRDPFDLDSDVSTNVSSDRDESVDDDVSEEGNISTDDHYYREGHP